MADDIRKEVAAESVADACSTSVPAIYSLAKGDKANKGVAYNAFPKFVAPKCDEDLLEDPAVRDELLARRGYAKEIRNRYASAVPDYGEDSVRAAGQAGTHSIHQPVIESGRTREQSDRNVEH